MSDTTFQEAIALAVAETEFMSPVRAARHRARLAMTEAAFALSGRSGLSLDEQTARLATAKEALQRALAIVDELHTAKSAEAVVNSGKEVAE